MSATPKYTWSKTTSSILKPHQDGRPLRGWTVGGRLFRMPGMDLKSLRKHYSLIPLFFCVGAGVCGATLYLIRLATCCPDVTLISVWQLYLYSRVLFFALPEVGCVVLSTVMLLIPLFGCVMFGVVGSGLYLLRLATCCPDVAWIQQEKQPWERLPPTYQYKFYSPNIDYSKLKTPPERPDI